MCCRVACDLAALLSERDPIRDEPSAPADADIETRLRAAAWSTQDVASGQRVDGDAVRRIRARIRSHAATSLGGGRARSARCARRRQRNRIGCGTAARIRVSGSHWAASRAALRPVSAAQRKRRRALRRASRFPMPQYVVAAELDGRRPESRIFLAAPRFRVTTSSATSGDQITLEQEIAWDARERSVIARERDRLGAIVLAERPLRHPDADAVATALLEGVRELGVEALPWSDGARSLQPATRVPSSRWTRRGRMSPMRRSWPR